MIYSGRNPELVGPVFEQIEEELQFGIRVRYGGTAELAAMIMEEGENSPADIFYAQDAGALGALQAENLLIKLPDYLLDQVDLRFRSPAGYWAGITGRARVLNYNIELVKREQLPDSIWGLTDERWRGEVGWAPANASFQAFLSALRQIKGEQKAREWLEAMIENDVQVYPRNTPIVAALGRGEISLGLVNNYYLPRFRAEDPNFSVAAHFMDEDSGAMINVSGAAILRTSGRRERARAVLGKLLEPAVQEYFAAATFEYPLREGVTPPADQRPLSDVKTSDLDLSDIADLQATVRLLREVGAL